jgi:hypothetical protein
MVVTDTAAEAGELEDRRLPTSTLDGRRRFVRADPAPIELLPAQRWSKLPEPERRNYDEVRIAHHAEPVVVASTVGVLSPTMSRQRNNANSARQVRAGQQTGYASRTANSCARGHPMADHGQRRRRLAANVRPGGRVPSRSAIADALNWRGLSLLRVLLPLATGCIALGGGPASGDEQASWLSAR